MIHEVYLAIEWGYEQTKHAKTHVYMMHHGKFLNLGLMAFPWVIFSPFELPNSAWPVLTFMEVIHYEKPFLTINNHRHHKPNMCYLMLFLHILIWLSGTLKRKTTQKGQSPSYMVSSYLILTIYDVIQPLFIWWNWTGRRPWPWPRQGQPPRNVAVSRLSS